jgi:glycosyltransferase involved in cell wall biosynthesis
VKITFVLPGRARAGGVLCTVHCANGLITRGHTVRILYKSPPIRRLVRNTWILARYGRNADGFERYKSTRAAYKSLTGFTFDKDELVVATGPYCALEVATLPPGQGIKVQYVRGITLPNLEDMYRAWRLDIPIIVVASYLVEEIRNKVGKEVVEIVRDGVSTEDYYPCEEESKRNGIGTIYGVGAAKAPETILAVLGLLRKQFQNVPQHVFGSCSPPKEIDQKTFIRYPSIAQARSMYSKSLVWFCASRSEGFPGPVLEAMACGCVVVSTDCGGPRDIIKHGENGFLAEVGNVEQIVKYVTLVLQNDSLHKKMSQEARRTANKFTWDRTIDLLEECLLKILNKTGG